MTTGIVIAGGTSSRFGSADKALATVGNSPMIRRVIDRLVPVVDRVVVNARGSQRSSFAAVLADMTCPVQFAIDRCSDGGPVAGLATALEVVTDERVLVLGCDFPLIQTSTLSCLLDRLENTAVVSAVDGRKPDCVLPLVDGQPQPLCGAYSVDALEAAIGALSNARNQSFGDVLDHLNVVPISHERLPGRSATFENVNTRDDLRTARAIVQNERRNYRRH